MPMPKMPFQGTGSNLSAPVLGPMAAESTVDPLVQAHGEIQDRIHAVESKFHEDLKLIRNQMQDVRPPVEALNRLFHERINLIISLLHLEKSIDPSQVTPELEDALRQGMKTQSEYVNSLVDSIQQVCQFLDDWTLSEAE